MANKNVTKKALAEKDAEIKKNMEILGISREEAEEMWAFDHDEIDCEEVDAIEDKIKETQKSDKKKTGSPLDKVRNMKAKKKADAEKHNIIQSVFNFLKTLGETGEIVSPQEMSTTKMSFKGVNGGYYTVTITKHKSCPDGYKEP
jgi:hypothetical protein